MNSDLVPALILCIVVLILMAIFIFVPANDNEEYKAILTRSCMMQWNSFETRLVEVSNHKFVCQVFHEGKWLPSENVVFDLNK